MMFDLEKQQVVKPDGRYLIYYRFARKPMQVLVTGGAGYIGSVVVEELLNVGHEVVVFDSLVKGHREAVLAPAELVTGDLADRPALDALFRLHRIDAVIHLAGFIEVGESVRNPAKYYRNNVANTLNLLETMLAHDVRRFVFSSTAAVYGQPQTIPVQETDPLAPTNPYGETKLAIERALHWYSQGQVLRYVSLRYFNAAGATEWLGEDHEPESHLIPALLLTALGRRPHVELYGTDYPTPDGTCIRDYIHVGDLATAHVLALKRLQAGSAVYNLGNGNGFSNRQVIETAREVTGRPIPVIEAPRRPGDAPVLVASAEKLTAELGWQPRYSDLQTIVASAWEWRQRHPDGYPT